MLSQSTKGGPVELDLSISYDVKDADPRIEKILEEIVGEEARGFAETIRQRLAAEGVQDITMNLTETR
jgi:hypothetical protein